jgi:hypothetical protein
MKVNLLTTNHNVLEEKANMSFMESMLSNKMKEADPALDILGSDRKMFQVAYQDFINYVTYHWKLAGKETSNCNIVEKIEQFFEEEPFEFDSFLTIWIGIWMKKWKERVKLFIGNQNRNELSKDYKTLSNAKALWEKLECRQEMVELVTSTLIKNAEICGTAVLAEHLLKMELGKKDNPDVNNKEHLFVILNNALRAARDMTKNVGPLIFVKVDKGYYGKIDN